MARFWLDERPARPLVKVPRQDLRRATALAKSAWDEGERLGAAGDYGGALRWLGRAHRIAPADQNILFALAFAHWRAGDSVGAASLFGDLWRRHGSRETACGLLAALLSLRQREQALNVLDWTLRETAIDASLAALAARVAPLWCGIGEDGVLHVTGGQGRVVATLHGKRVRLKALGESRYGLPEGLGVRGLLAVFCGGEKPAGSPLDLGRIFRVEGFVERRGGLIAGWLWYPGAPGRVPRITIKSPEGQVLERVVARPGEASGGGAPLAQPRAFRVAMRSGGPVQVSDEAGQALLGSPVPAEPVLPWSAVGNGRKVAASGVASKRSAGLGVDVIIPVYRGAKVTLACLESVFASAPRGTRIRVVNDASPDAALVAGLEKLAAKGRIALLPSSRDGDNLGFPGAVNAGLRAASGRHVLLLNSDTLIAEGSVETLRDAALSAPDIGTATPLSNDASILSYPDVAGVNPVPDLEATRRLAALAAAANRGRLVDLPTAHGFCMFIRADCLQQTGLFEEQLFSQGYGEENDFCARASALGWRHVAVPEVFVAHVGGQSFGPARLHLLRRNLDVLERRHPGYRARVQRWIAADPLSAARHALDAARFAAAGEALAKAAAGRRSGKGAARGMRQRAAVLVTHGMGGGTRHFVLERAAQVEALGLRAVILQADGGGCCIEGLDETYPNLRFALPGDAAGLTGLLRSAGAEFAEIHHLLGHRRAILDVLRALGLEYDLYVHDYAWFCHRLSFVTGAGRFCGEAPATECERCVREWGSEIGERIAPAALRARSARDFAAARHVYVASEDVERRVRRFVPGLSPELRPWERLAVPAQSATTRRGETCRVAIVGAIGVEKGFDVLLACARDAAVRGLRLEFVVIGYTERDEALLETGKVFITGRFKASEAEPLIRAQGADLAFIPSIWPETWCYALSDAWSAGLPAVVFDIGTPPLRVRAARRGWVLPLGLPATRVNDALLSFGLRNNIPASSPAL